MEMSKSLVVVYAMMWISSCLPKMYRPCLDSAIVLLFPFCLLNSHFHLFFFPNRFFSISIFYRKDVMQHLVRRTFSPRSRNGRFFSLLSKPTPVFRAKWNLPSIRPPKKSPGSDPFKWMEVFVAQMISSVEI